MKRVILILAIALLASPAVAIDEFVVHKQARERGVVFSMDDVIDAVADYWPEAEVVTVETVAMTDIGRAAFFDVELGDFVWRVNVLNPPQFIEDGVAKQSLHGGLILHDATGHVVAETKRGHYKKNQLLSRSACAPRIPRRGCESSARICPAWRTCPTCRKSSASSAISLDT